MQQYQILLYGDGRDAKVAWSQCGKTWNQSIDVQRLANDKQILTRKFEAEATLRSGLEKRYEDQIHITSKTELAFNLKDELLHAKDETIRSLKATLSYQKNC